MSTSAARPDRTLLVILCIVGALIVVALIVVFTRGTPAPLDPDTPEGVVQRYSAAVIDGDELTASDYLTDDALESCEKFERGPTDGIRITLVSTNEREASADVTVSITTTYSNGPFGSSESEFEDVFDLVEVDGEWRIDRAPWQLTICPTVAPR